MNNILYYFAISFLLFSCSVEQDFNTPQAINTAQLVINISNCDYYDCRDQAPMNNQEVLIFETIENAENNADPLRKGFTDEKGTINFSFTESREVIVKVDLNNQVYIKSERLTPNSISYVYIEKVKDCLYEGINAERTCEFYNTIFPNNINKFLFYYSNSYFSECTINYTGDTLFVEKSQINDSTILIKEYFKNPSDLLKSKYTRIFQIDSTYETIIKLDQNKKISLENISGDRSRSHIFLTLDYFYYGDLDSKNFNFRQFKENEHEIEGCTIYSKSEDSETGFILNYEPLSVRYDSLNILNDYTGSTVNTTQKYIYSGRHGIINTLSIYAQSYTPVYGFMRI